MKTQSLFKNFHKKSQMEIAELAKEFIDDDFFVNFPELKNKISILLTGSVAGGYYDSQSDIDLNIIFSNLKSWKEYKFKLLDHFKGKYLKSKKKPIELHGQNITHFPKIISDLKSWNHDWMLREFFDAIIIHDPKNKIKELKERFAWYPKDIFQEKINWLFAESSFLLFDRYKIGMSRSSFYYIETIKIKTLRLFMASLVLINSQYPTSDKHLYNNIAETKEYLKIQKTIDKILLEKQPKNIFKLLLGLRKAVEKILAGKKLIKKTDKRYWIGLRPNHRIEIEK